MHAASRLVVLAALLVLAALPAAAQQRAPKNIILLYADGTAATQWEFARYSSKLLRNSGFAVTDVVFHQGTLGFLTTHPYEAFATDSAATASAMSTGVKTTVGAIGVGPDGKPARTAAEVAKAHGKRIGIVSTAEVYDASPAAFSVHAKSRRDADSIVSQYLALEPDVLMGGGADKFPPQVLAAFRAKGYKVARNRAELRGAGGPRLLGLFAEGSMSYAIDRAGDEEPSFADMMRAALATLSAGSPKGFFLFFENENTDTAGHRNDAAALMRDLWAFDEALRVALEFQRGSPDTLIIVTGDHETGGLSITYALRNLSDTSSKNRFYAGDVHLRLLSGVSISFDKAVETLGKKPAGEALDKLLVAHFPEFRLDRDLRDAILGGQLLERNYGYAVQNALGRMVARQTGIYWGTSGHTTEPVTVGALGPGAERFKGYHDNTDFARILHALLGQQH
ncbi:MAG TPA: alkaline phosphatase [Burkholderiales bacterium]